MKKVIALKHMPGIPKNTIIELGDSTCWMVISGKTITIDQMISDEWLAWIDNTNEEIQILREMPFVSVGDKIKVFDGFLIIPCKIPSHRGSYSFNRKEINALVEDGWVRWIKK